MSVRAGIYHNAVIALEITRVDTLDHFALEVGLKKAQLNVHITAFFFDIAAQSVIVKRAVDALFSYAEHIEIYAVDNHYFFHNSPICNLFDNFHYFFYCLI